MLDLGWTEIMLIAAVAVLVISPKDLPRAMRTVGNWVGQMKRMARGFQRQFNEALREAELDDVQESVKAIGKIDPVGDVRKEMRKVDNDIRKDTTAPSAKAGTESGGAAAETTDKAPAAGPDVAPGEEAKA